jgi:leader peptidase (prepilin peptidase)/N-methyltransferase
MSPVDAQLISVFFPWLAGLAGLLLGSFLNVCIYRWPLEVSVVTPRSHCPNCDFQIAWYDNIPLVSWFLLKGRCRACHDPISWRYPVVEALTAICFAIFAVRFGTSLPFFKMSLFAAILIGLLFSDLETLLLPDEFTVGGAVLGLMLSFVVLLHGGIFGLLAAIAGFAPDPRVISAGEALLGAVIPAGSLWLLGWVFEKVRNKEGLGFGDVKMIAMIGAFLGLRGALFTVILGSLLGSIIGIAFIKLAGKDPGEYPLPFGTFLAVAGLIVAFAEPWIGAF